MGGSRPHTVEAVPQIEERQGDPMRRRRIEIVSTIKSNNPSSDDDDLLDQL